MGFVEEFDGDADGGGELAHGGGECWVLGGWMGGLCTMELEEM